MTARCGSGNPTHVARRCADCKKVYRKRYRDGAPRLARHYVNPAVCAVCGLAAGNSLDIKVYRYPLMRHRRRQGKQASFYVGAIGLCDDCIGANASVPVRRAA